MSRPSRVYAILALAGALVTLAFGFNHWMKPQLQAQRDRVVSTPSLGGIWVRSVVGVDAGERACIEGVKITPDVDVARVRVFNPFAGRPAPLRFDAIAPGYHASQVVRTYEPVPGDALVSARLTPPPRDVEGKVCVSPIAHQGFGLVGTNEARSQVPATTTVDGRPAKDGVDAELTLLHDGRTTLVHRFGDIVDHASGFSGGAMPPWLVWPLLVLVIAGIPLATLFALWRSVRSGPV